MNETSAAATERAPLPREVIEFLLDLCGSMQRYAIYPRGHPLLANAADSVTRRLDVLLRARETLALGIARERLLVDGMLSDAQHPLLRDLAQRLHRHRIGTLKFVAGITNAEFADLLTALAVDPAMTGKQLGPLSEQLQRWPHVRLTLVSFDRLALAAEPAGPAAELGPERATTLWLALARAGLGAAASTDPDAVEQAESVDPEALARAIEARDDPDGDQPLVSCLLEITDALRSASGLEAEELRERVSQFIRSLRPETLRRLLAMGGDAQQRKRLVMNASDELAIDAVLALVKAAAEASGQAISHAMLRLLAKLALQAEEGGAALKAGATAALREQIHQLVERWDADLLNAESYQRALDRMARLRLLALMTEREHPCEPHRLVALSIEVSALGAPVWRAIAEMIRKGEIGPLLDLLDRAPEGNVVASELWTRVATPDNVRHMLREESTDLTLLDRLAGRMGAAIIPPLLDALETAQARATRRKLLDLLSAFGVAVGTPVTTRLGAEAPWFVQRNLLTLLQRLPELPQGFTPARFLSAADPRVRREAFKLMLRLPAKRDDAITTALADKDERIVQMALIAAGDACPRAAVPVIIRRVSDRTMHAELRLLGVRVAATVRSPVMLEWLLHFTMGKRGWFRRRRLAPKSPEMLAALSGLATVWGSEPQAQPVLALARRDADPEVRGAVQAGAQ